MNPKKIHLFYLLALLLTSIEATRQLVESNDSELMKMEASSNGKVKSTKNGNDKPKTLSQQVADGKYGLIQKELFRKPPKRPGILSYHPNPEVPNDTSKNLGGLNKNEIWLAENHLLVLRGGNYPPYEDKNEIYWSPIDNYKAPLHQVKIPLKPKVPPPFPVQLTENGPIQIIGANNSISQPSIITQTGQTQTENSDKTNVTSWQNTLPISNAIGDNPGLSKLNQSVPSYIQYIPPGAIILPENITDFYDDDDPSIYYPPPYSFFYPKDNSSVVPPGPLVPGIILPPPPNFFSLLDEGTTTELPRKKQKKPTTVQPVVTQIQPTVKPVRITQIPTEKPIKVYPVKDFNYNNEFNRKPKVLTRKKPENVTVLKPVVTTTQVPLKYYTSNNVEFYEKTQRTRAPKTTPKPAQYYYYEEPENVNKYVRTNRPRYRTRRPQYVYVTAKPYNTQKPRFRFVQQPVKNRDSFSIHIAKLHKHINEFYTTQRAVLKQSKPVYSYSFEAANYRQQEEFKPSPVDDNNGNFRPVPQRYSVEIQPSIQPNLHQEQPRPQPQQPEYNVEIQPAIQIIPTQQPPPVYYQHQPPKPENYYSTPKPENYYSTPKPENYYSTPKPENYYSTPKPENYYTTPKPENYYSTPKPENYYTTPKPENYYSTPRPVYSTARKPLKQYYEVTPNPVYQGYYTKPDEGYFDDNTREYFTVFGRKLPEPTTALPLTINPVSLNSDTIVNYVKPKPTISPHAETYPKVVRYTSKPNAEIVKAVEINPESYISYPLPGDEGAHFYFLTPQLAKSRDQGAGFYYTQSNDRRIRQRRENDEKS